MNPLGLFQSARGGCFTAGKTGFLPGIAFLGRDCILFNIGLSWSETSDSILKGPGDFGAFLVSFCIIFTTGSSSSLLSSESSDSVSTNSGDLVLFGTVSVSFLPQNSLSLFLHVVSCYLPKNHPLI